MSTYLYSSSFVNDPHRIKSCISKKSVEIGGPSDPYQMAYLHTVLIATVLEDAILQFRINMNTSNEWRVRQTQAEYGKQLAIKYGVEQPKEIDDLADIDPRKLNCEEYKLNKLFADRFYLRDVLDETYVNLCIDCSFSVFAEHVKTFEETIAHRTFVLQDEMKNRLLRRDMAKQLRLLRNHIKSATYDANCTISELRRRVELNNAFDSQQSQKHGKPKLTIVPSVDAVVNAEVKTRYVESWQVARSEQNTHRIKEKESKVSANTEFYKLRYDQEMRVHSEIDLVTNIMLNETLEDIDRWMTRYDEDIEMKDLKIQIMKNNYVTQKEKREELEATIEEHDKDMKDWQQFKTDRENARLYREKMHNAAITVQAWWRGFLVRNQLGPYKPQPKKRGTKDDKKDKKKK